MNIMVKMWLDGDFVALRTYDRKHGGRGRFLICYDRLLEWVQKISDEETFYDSDCGHMLQVRQVNNTARFKVLWLSEYDNGDVRGFMQRFDVPMEQMRLLLESSMSIRILYHEKKGNAHISCRNSGTFLKGIIADKYKRHALRKAMRDCFQWHGDSVTLYPDGANSFYFTTSGSWAINGGLVLHEGLHGKHKKVVYSVHT